MPEVKTQPVRATIHQEMDLFDLPPGAFKYYREADRDPAGLIYRCPCGCLSTGSLRFRPCDPAHPSWEWDGNREAPTLTPSVHHVGHWHGWLRAGVWTSC